MQTQERLSAYALNSLRDAQTRFKKNPNATNWSACLRAMLIYQQTFHACTSPAVDKALFNEIDTAPQSHWDNIVCQHTMGMTAQEAYNTYAFN